MLSVPIPPRADIVDRNGVPLARNIDGYAVSVNPDKIMGDKRVLARYPNAAEVVWAQEEPKNMGAWTYVAPRRVPARMFRLL